MDIVSQIRHQVIDARTAHEIVNALAGRFAQHLDSINEPRLDNEALRLLDEAAMALGDFADIEPGLKAEWAAA